MTTSPTLSLLTAPVLDSTADVLALVITPALLDDAAALPEALRLANDALGVDLRAAARAEGFKAQSGQVFDLLTLGRIKARRLCLVGAGELPASQGLVEALQLAGAHAARRARALKAPSLAVAGLGDHLASPEAAEQLLIGAALGTYDYTSFRTDPDQQNNPLQSVAVAAASLDLDRLRSLIDAIYLARDLGNGPTNVTTPVTMVALARDLAARFNFSIEVIQGDDLLARGMNLIHAVGKGSNLPPALIHLTYTPPGESKGRVAFVGKGVTFDTGGYSLKPWQSQINMHLDMAGAAAVFGAAQFIGERGAAWTVDFFVPTVENNVSHNAYKPMDVIKGYGGKTVEIVNTDAEGRLILADALARAAELQPDFIIDLATLTGACLVALGDNTAGALGSDQALINKVLASADATGEHMWQLPLNEKLRSKLKSPIADMRNASTQPYGGTITGALFLKSWVGDRPWVHLDIAGPAMSDQDRTISPPGGSGYGVATLVELLNRL